MHVGRRSLAAASRLIIAGALLAIADLHSGSAAAAPSDVGEWSPVYPWPNSGIHLNLLPDGKVLSWATGETTYPGYNKGNVVKIPHGQAPGNIVDAINTKSNLFCSGHVFLPDGKLFVTGGRSCPQTYGHSDVNIFDARGGNTWKTFVGFPRPC